MDAPWVVALFVFIGIFVMFFIISLLSDLMIVGIIISSAAAAYFIPDIYQAPYFQDALKQMSFLRTLGITFPEQLDTATHYLLATLVIFCGTLACIPALPFSYTYRQMLGADRMNKRDEVRVRRLVAEELEILRQRISGNRQSQPRTATAPPPEPESEVIGEARVVANPKPYLQPKQIKPEPNNQGSTKPPPFIRAAEAEEKTQNPPPPPVAG